MRTRLSAGEARRTALAAQGFGEPRPSFDAAAPPLKPRHLDRLLARLGLLQIDSVNVLARAHYLPPFARLGPYPTALLEQAAWTKRPRRLFEYWGHEASLLPVSAYPLLRWRMARAARGEGIYAGLARFGRERPEEIAAALQAVRERGPLAASDLENGRGKGSWWGWSDAKRAMEWLFWAGEVTTAGRRGAFERVYDLPERVLPAAVLAEPVPDEATAQRILLAAAARALGVATARDLRDYYRMDAADARLRLPELVESGTLLPVEVEGWTQPAFLDPAARVPRRIAAQALLCPFDPLIWERDRTERLFGFRYRIEIYVPAEKRLHGYYVLPFLLGDRLVARVDLKADREAGRLRVAGAHLEPGQTVTHVAPPLARELALMAGWLGLGGIAVTGGGALAQALAAEAGGAAVQ